MTTTEYFVEGKYKNGDDFFEAFWDSLDDLIDDTNARGNSELDYPVTVFEQVENHQGDTITKPLFQFNR